MKQLLRLMLLAISVMLTACGTGDSQRNYDHGYQYDQSGETGLRVRFGDATSLDFETIETIFREMEVCTGLTATGPLLIFVQNITGPEPRPYGGLIYFDTGTVLINEGFSISYIIYSIKHEFVHHLVYQSSGDTSHESPLFNACARTP